MASPTHIYMTRVRLKKRAQGKARKKKVAREGTTPTKAAVFGDNK